MNIIFPENISTWRFPALIMCMAMLVTALVAAGESGSKKSGGAHSKPHYDTSSVKLEEAQGKLGFAEGASWFEQKSDSSKINPENVFVGVSAVRRMRPFLQKIIEFYRHRFQGCSRLDVRFYPYDKIPHDAHEALGAWSNCYASYRYDKRERVDSLELFGATGK